MRIRHLLALLLFPATALQAADLIIPAAAHSPGVNGTFFQTDLRLVNLSSTLATVELAWLPSNSDNTSPQKTTTTISPRGSRAIDDAVQFLFAVTNGGGAIRITSASDLAVTSRTYTTSSSAACSGTFGQFIAAIDASTALKKSVLANVRLSADSRTGFRSNVGLVNPAAIEVAVALRLRDSNGASIASASTTVPPQGHTQNSVAALFSTATLTNDNLFIEVDAAQPVIAYVSVIDNASGDPIFIPAIADTGTSAPVTPVIIARKWVFEPATIEARVGEEVTVVIRAIDIEQVDHGVGFSGVGPFTCSSDQAGQCVLRPGENVTITFTPRTAGSFAFFCTRFCGESSDGSAGHATMRGTIVVK